jgi:predicted ATP-dependent endonuclease of OLD family
MVALRRFLVDRSDFSINDFTLSHWPKIDATAAKWESATDDEAPEPADCFSDALTELEGIGYPGVTDPKLTITTNIRPIDGLNHGSAVQYEVPTHLAGSAGAHRLPEDSNGLGYQNLVSIVFALMGFRDKWMKVGKAGKSKTSEEALIPPLHLVLIEEPEAHLHAQVQQVFIKQAFGVLRKHDKLKDSHIDSSELQLMLTCCLT